MTPPRWAADTSTPRGGLRRDHGRRARRGRRLVTVATVCLTLSLGAGSASSGPSLPFPGGAYFNLACGFSHRNNDDPIQHPRQAGRSHNHTYIGNRTVHAFTTPETLRQRGETTCEIDDDLSTYWVPTLYLGAQPVEPYAGVVYYVKLTRQTLRPIPPDLKIVAGNPSARRAQPTSVVSWSCGGIGSSRRFAAVPSCGQDDALELRVVFPSCWNGRTSDSPNHKRHMAYPNAVGRCAATHPVAVPTLILVLLYPPVPKAAIPSSGRFGAHADFMNGWNQDAFARLVASLNAARPTYP
ncbi:MAG TPA: DUF1996 domain-containing protein [Gaiellaceae bacterium]|nr:DUF1996 domain-containing protein [Gaiellaceae bacterium]